MSAPGMTAERSLYKSTVTYRSAVAQADRGVDRVALAYAPTAGPMEACNECVDGCAKSLAYCSAGAAVAVAGCFFPPACFAAIAAAAAIQATCDVTAATCTSVCAATTCCPKHCSGIPTRSTWAAAAVTRVKAACPRTIRTRGTAAAPSTRPWTGACCAKGEICCGGQCVDPATGTCTPRRLVPVTEPRVPGRHVLPTVQSLRRSRRVLPPAAPAPAPTAGALPTGTTGLRHPLLPARPAVLQHRRWRYRVHDQLSALSVGDGLADDPPSVRNECRSCVAPARLAVIGPREGETTRGNTARMERVVRPGGWLLIQSADLQLQQLTCPDPTSSSEELPPVL